MSVEMGPAAGAGHVVFLHSKTHGDQEPHWGPEAEADTEFMGWLAQLENNAGLKLQPARSPTDLNDEPSGPTGLKALMTSIDWGRLD